MNFTSLRGTALMLCMFPVMEMAWAEPVFPTTGSKAPPDQPAELRVTMGRCCSGPNAMNVAADFTSDMKLCGTTGNNNNDAVNCYKCNVLDTRPLPPPPANRGTGFYETVGIVCDYNFGLDGQPPYNTSCLQGARKNCSQIAAECARIASGHQAPFFPRPNKPPTGQLCPVNCSGPNFPGHPSRQRPRPAAYCYRANGTPPFVQVTAAGACPAGYTAMPPAQGELCHRNTGNAQNPNWQYVTIVPPATTCPAGYTPLADFCYRSVDLDCNGRATQARACVELPIGARKLRCGSPQVGVTYGADD